MEREQMLLKAKLAERKLKQEPSTCKTLLKAVVFLCVTGMATFLTMVLATGLLTDDTGTDVRREPVCQYAPLVTGLDPSVTHAIPLDEQRFLPPDSESPSGFVDGIYYRDSNPVTGFSSYLVMRFRPEVCGTVVVTACDTTGLDQPAPLNGSLSIAVQEAAEWCGPGLAFGSNNALVTASTQVSNEDGDDLCPRAEFRAAAGVNYWVSLGTTATANADLPAGQMGLRFFLAGDGAADECGDPCPAGSFGDSVSGCIACGAGMFCPGAGASQACPAVAVPAEGVVNATTEAAACSFCPAYSTRTVGEDECANYSPHCEGAGVCAANFEGPRCSECPDDTGWFVTRDRCVRCLPLQYLLGSAAVLVGLVVVLFRLAQSSRRRMIGFRIVAHGVQLFAFVVLLGGVRWPSEFEAAYQRVMEFTGLRFGVAIAECYFGAEWTRNSTAVAVTSLTVPLTVLYFFWLVMQDAKHKAAAEARSAAPSLRRLFVYRGRSAAAARLVHLFLTLLYPSLVERFLSLVRCNQEGRAQGLFESGSSGGVLDSDLRTNCHEALSIFGLVFGGLIGVLSPAGLAFYMRHGAQAPSGAGGAGAEGGLSELTVRATIAEPYDSSVPAFDAVIMLRKLGMLLILTLVNGEGNFQLQASLALGFSFAFFVLGVWMMRSGKGPYRFLPVPRWLSWWPHADYANSADVAGSGLLTVSYVVVLFDGSEDPEEMGLAAVVVGVLNVLFVLLTTLPLLGQVDRTMSLEEQRRNRRAVLVSRLKTLRGAGSLRSLEAVANAGGDGTGDVAMDRLERMPTFGDDADPLEWVLSKEVVERAQLPSELVEMLVSHAVLRSRHAAMASLSSSSSADSLRSRSAGELDDALRDAAQSEHLCAALLTEHFRLSVAAHEHRAAAASAVVLSLVRAPPEEANDAGAPHAGDGRDVGDDDRDVGDAGPAPPTRPADLPPPPTPEGGAWAWNVGPHRDAHDAEKLELRNRGDMLGWLAVLRAKVQPVGGGGGGGGMTATGRPHGSRSRRATPCFGAARAAARRARAPWTATLWRFRRPAAA